MVDPCSTRVECTLKSMLIALLTLSPLSFKMTSKLFGEVKGAKGCPTSLGFVMHLILFGIVTMLAYSFDLYASLRSARGDVVDAAKDVQHSVEKLVGIHSKKSDSSSKKSVKSAPATAPVTAPARAAVGFRSAQEEVGVDDDVNVTKLSQEKGSMRGYKTAGLQTRSASKINVLGSVTRSSIARKAGPSMTSQNTVRSAREQA